MRRKFIFSFNENYHIYNRGVEKRAIFLDVSDYHRFILLLKIANDKSRVDLRERKKLLDLGVKINDQRDTLVDIGAWCLMPNHFHLLLHEKIDGGVSKFMSKLLTGYTMYFNRKYQRKGCLFENTFQAEYLDTDNYLKYIFSYIHLNPVKLIDPLWKDNGLKDLVVAKDFLDKYSYSSYSDYMGKNREENEILKKEAFPEYFLNIENFESNLLDWLTFTKDSPL
jgi:putative transposase